MAEAIETYDLVVVGGGPGGYVAAIRGAQSGLNTAIIEGHKLGGECLNYGCIPSKALISAGHLVERIEEQAPMMGIKVSGLNIDMAEMVGWKGKIVKQLTGGIGQLLKANGVKSYKGQGSFDSIDTEGLKILNVDTGIDPYDGSKVSGEKTVTQLRARHVIIATGSEVVEIPSMPFDGKHVLNSRQALDVDKLPESVVVVGGGFIGLEIGTFLMNLGVKITVIEGTDTLLPGTDPECVAVVKKRLEKRGAKLLFSHKAKAIKALKNSKTLVQVEDASNKAVELECDWALVTVGRRPRTRGLNLEAIGLECNEKGFIPVNAELKTSVEGVYAIGDVIGNPMLAHKASKEGLVAVENILHPGTSMDILALPWAIFVDPEIAVVGHSEESAKEAGWDPVVGKCPFMANGRALSTGSSEGFVKIIADRSTDRLLGAHMVGPEVSNLIAEVAVAIEMGGTAADLGRIVHAHPTLPETIMEAAESVHGMAVHFFEPKKKRPQAASEAGTQNSA